MKGMIIMNMQKIMQEAKKMQVQLQKDQKEIEDKIYEGSSSLVKISMNGKYQVLSVKFEVEDDFTKDDIEMLEDMVQVAMNDVIKKINQEKEKKMGKYGQGLAGLM